MDVWAVVVAAGGGTRFGARKQYERLRGRRVLDWSLAAASAACDQVILVVPPDRVDVPEPGAKVVAGGATRSTSVRAGLAAVPASAEIVVIHDAARPLARPELFTAAIEAVRAGADGAIAAVPLADTVKRVAGAGLVAETVDRAGLWAAQTPQAFRAAALRAAHAGQPEGTDDAALVEANGGRVVVVEGDPANRKLTHPYDLEVADAMLGQRQTRVGLGFDVHPFSDDPIRPLVLAGVTVPGERGLAGHSDADAVAHAVADAILGAAGLGDIGSHFPDTDAAYAGADSMALLGRVRALVEAAGWRVGNVDCTVVLEAPKLAPHRDAMVAGLRRVLDAGVGLKATRAEQLGAIGRGEGVACLAVALLEQA